MMDNYIKKVQQASNDVWKTYKRFLLHELVFTDTWWESLMAELKAVHESYVGTEAEYYVRNYVNVCIQEIERLSSAKEPNLRMKTLFFDTETSGLKPGQIGQLAVIIVDGQSVVGKNYYFEIDDIEAGAAKVTGRDLDFYREASDGVRFTDKADEIHEMFTGATLVAHNIKFDNMFMRAELHRCEKVLQSEREFDTMSYFKDICKLPGNRFGYKNPKLEEVIKFLNIDEAKVAKYAQQLFGLESSEYHDATYDTTAMYVAFMVQSGLNNSDYSWANVFCKE